MTHFDFHSLRFEFEARERIVFPRGLAANTLRGALGLHLRRRDRLYEKVFEPKAAPGAAPSPSGLADWPRPFVFRARHLNHRIIAAGESFHFDVNVFSGDPCVLESFGAAFADIAREGLGPGRGTAELLRVQTTPLSYDLAPHPGAPEHIRVTFLSPCELKHEGRVVERPEFPILFARIRDRIGALRALYGPGPLDIDFQGIGARSEEVRMMRCDLRRVEQTRRSTRTGQVHPIGGFAGQAEYAGNMAEFLPWLEAAYWTGVGRHTAWGQGEIQVTAISA